MEASDGNGGEIPSSGPPSPPPPPPTGFLELFRFADKLDYVLMAIGTIGAIGHGCSMPTFLRIFAALINSIASNPSNTDKMMKEVVQVVLIFIFNLQ